MGIITTIVGSLVTLVVSLLVGGLGIYVGAMLVTGDDDFETALWTASLGSLAWVLTSLVLGWISLLGGLLSLVIGLALYLGVISMQYDADWVQAAAIAFVAWIAVVVVRTLIAPLIGPFGAIGVPFA